MKKILYLLLLVTTLSFGQGQGAINQALAAQINENTDRINRTAENQRTIDLFTQATETLKDTDNLVLNVDGETFRLELSQLSEYIGSEESLTNVEFTNNNLVFTTSEDNTITIENVTIEFVQGLQDALDLKANQTDLNTHINDVSNPHNVTQTQVGLGNVDNTSDINKPISTATQNALDGKQDISPTDGNSYLLLDGSIVQSEIYTPTEKTKLAGIETGANNYILPSDVVQDANYVHTDNNFTNAFLSKLNTIENGAQVNVNADWDEVNTLVDAFILNKPTNLSDFTNDEGFITASDVDLTGVARLADNQSFEGVNRFNSTVQFARSASTTAPYRLYSNTNDVLMLEAGNSFDDDVILFEFDPEGNDGDGTARFPSNTLLGGNQAFHVGNLTAGTNTTITETNGVYSINADDVDVSGFVTLDTEQSIIAEKTILDADLKFASTGGGAETTIGMTGDVTQIFNNGTSAETEILINTGESQTITNLVLNSEPTELKTENF